jgi:hypothetical protein
VAPNGAIESTPEPLVPGTTEAAAPTLPPHIQSLLDSSGTEVPQPGQFSQSEGLKIRLSQDLHLYGTDRPRRRYVRAKIILGDNP